MLRFTKLTAQIGFVLFIIALLTTNLTAQPAKAFEQISHQLVGVNWKPLPVEIVRQINRIYEIEINRSKPVANLATPAPAATAQATKTPAPATSATTAAKEEAELLELINAYRKANKLPTVAINTTLTKAARWMSQDMASKHYLSHTDSLGRTAFKRIAAFGYPSDTHRGENIGAGYETATGVMEGWKNSPTHLANLLNPNYRVVGISRVYDPAAPYKWYWTTDYGSR